MTTDSFAPTTSNYNHAMQATQCNQSSYLPMQNNLYPGDNSMLQHSAAPSNTYVEQNCVNVYNNEFSPDNSSYSENSDYTSDDFEDEYAADKQQSAPIQSNANYIASNQEMGHNMNSMSSSSSSSNVILPPFPSINPSCDMSASIYKDNQCHAYQESNLYHNPYNYSTIQDSNSMPATHHDSMFVNHSTYEMQNSSSNYSYTSEYKQNYTEMSNSTAPATAAISSATTTSEPTLIHQNETPAIDGQQQYIDLSLSIASSSSAESLLSAANTSDEDSRLTPVSFSHIPSTTVYPATGTDVCSNPFSHNYNGGGTEAELKEDGKVVNCNSQATESSSSSSEGPDLKSPNDNFGEIIKKTIVESVSA